MMMGMRIVMMQVKIADTLSLDGEAYHTNFIEWLGSTHMASSFSSMDMPHLKIM